MARHGYCGREPNTPLEYAQARIEAMYEAEDKARAQERFEEHTTDGTEPEPTKTDD